MFLSNRPAPTQCRAGFLFPLKIFTPNSCANENSALTLPHVHLVIIYLRNPRSCAVFGVPLQRQPLAD